MTDALFSVGANANLHAECVRLAHAWESYALGRQNPQGVRPVILESWNRCLESGLDPVGTRSPRMVPQAQVEDYTDNDPIFAEIKLALPPLETAARDLGHLLVCCDAEGHIMQIGGESSLRRRTDNMNFVPGADWSEYQAGTNAIGTAISTGEPIQVLASEHYCQAAHEWTCSGAPIRDPATQRVLAVLDMTGPREKCHRHTLVIIMAITQLIEERLRSKLEAERYELLEEYADCASRTPTTPLAVLDRGDRVVKASPVFHQRGWIDPQGRIVGSPRTKILSHAPVSWDTDVERNPCTFTMEPFIKRGRPAGSIVRVIKDSAIRVSQAPAASSRSGESHTFESLIGGSQALQSAVSLARSAADTEFPVLIEGETGTGKELIAQAIHAASHRRSMPFVAVNCGALSRELATSEFFGYDGGSFTGAAREGRIGKFEQANGGTLFLDEIGDMPVDLQAVLLRVLEEGSVVHVGGRKNIAVNVRVIVATNQDLLHATQHGLFRKDLYYRLSVLKILLPPLRARKEDLPSLFTFCLEKAFGSARRAVPRITPEVMRALHGHAWPGNVRELRNLAEWLAVNCTDPVLEVHHLPATLLHMPHSSSSLTESQESAMESPLKLRELETIRSVVDHCQGNVTEAAKRLRIHRSTIYRKLGRVPPYTS